MCRTRFLFAGLVAALTSLDALAVSRPPPTPRRPAHGPVPQVARGHARPPVAAGRPRLPANVPRRTVTPVPRAPARPIAVPAGGPSGRQRPSALPSVVHASSRGARPAPAPVPGERGGGPAFALSFGGVSVPSGGLPRLPVKPPPVVGDLGRQAADAARNPGKVVHHAGEVAKHEAGKVAPSTRGRVQFGGHGGARGSLGHAGDVVKSEGKKVIPKSTRGGPEAGKTLGRFEEKARTGAGRVVADGRGALARPLAAADVTVTKTSGSDGGSGGGGGGGSGSGGGSGGWAGPDPVSAAGGRMSSWYHEKVLKEPRSRGDDDMGPLVARNSAPPPKPVKPPSGSESQALNQAVLSKANEMASKRRLVPGPSGKGLCSDFVQQVLTDSGARPGANVDPQHRQLPQNDTFGRKVPANQVRPGDVATLPPGSQYEDARGGVRYTVDATGHTAIVTQVNGNVYTVVDQDGAGSPPTTHTIRITDPKGVQFFRPIYP